MDIYLGQASSSYDVDQQARCRKGFMMITVQGYGPTLLLPLPNPLPEINLGVSQFIVGQISSKGIIKRAPINRLSSNLRFVRWLLFSFFPLLAASRQHVLKDGFFRPNVPRVPYPLVVPLPFACMNSRRHITVADFSDHWLVLSVEQEIESQALGADPIRHSKRDFNATFVYLFMFINNGSTTRCSKIIWSV